MKQMKNIAATEKELNRLVTNQKAFLDAIPQPVLIINGTKNIEFMNSGAKKFFATDNSSPREGEKKSAEFFQRLISSFPATEKKHPGQPPYQIYFENYHLEYVFAPFLGYKGSSLQWMILRDISERKKQEDELSVFHNNIELILSQKINKLKESEKIRQQLSEQLIYLKSQIADLSSDDPMIGSSKPMNELREMISQVAQSDATILITGESGTGKELVANLIRESSSRKKKPFLKINCNTINDSLLESDLFGYEKGAFTGAQTKTKGKFEVVTDGTIFLDEIGDISERMQAALLRVLQNGEIFRVGGNSPISIDVRIIAATNKDLAQAVEESRFRLDLFYRLNIINVVIPPLRERKEDIEDLVAHFIRKYRLAFKREVDFVPRPVIDKLKRHHWPGNVRELENVIQRAVLMAKSNIITEQEIFFDTVPNNGNADNRISLSSDYDGAPLKTVLAEVEKEIICNSLRKHHGNVADSAKELKVGKTAFYDKLKRFGISTKEHR